MIQTLSDLKTACFNEQVNGMIILDQTLLPGREAHLTLTTAEEIRNAIYKLKVREAPTIEIVAVYGIYVCIRRIDTAGKFVFVSKFWKIKEHLAGSRPTVVSLVTTLNRMERTLVAHPTLSAPEWKELLYKEAITIREESVAACRQIGKNCLGLPHPGMGIFTHYNAGHLTVSGYDTALAPIYLGQERGHGFKVLTDETRPLLQGVRLTVCELSRVDVDMMLTYDNTTSIVTQRGWVHAATVGCDRVAANGDTTNKTGTSEVVVLAWHYKVPFYVLGPTSTIDGSCPDDDSITIEEHNPDEVTEIWYSRHMAPKGVKVYNPAFDVTPRELVATIIMEKGIFYKNNR